MNNDTNIYKLEIHNGAYRIYMLIGNQKEDVATVPIRYKDIAENILLFLNLENYIETAADENGGGSVSDY